MKSIVNGEDVRDGCVYELMFYRVFWFWVIFVCLGYEIFVCVLVNFWFISCVVCKNYYYYLIRGVDVVLICIVLV